MKKGLKVLLFICIVGFVICFGVFLKRHMAESEAQKKYISLSEMTESGTVKGSEEATESMADNEPVTVSEMEALQGLGIEFPDKSVDFAELRQSNPDIYAWIMIPGTAVDYPVVQHPEDDEYYLNHNLDKSRGYPGCIYTEPTVTSKNFDDFNTVIYGHNMRDGSMFATLHKYADSEFFSKNRYIYIYTPDRILVYEIFAAYTYSDIHLLKGVNLENGQAVARYIAKIYEQRGVNVNLAEDIEVTPDNHILTLSTCTNNDAKRFLVQGVLLNDAVRGLQGESGHDGQQP